MKGFFIVVQEKVLKVSERSSNLSYILNGYFTMNRTPFYANKIHRGKKLARLHPYGQCQAMPMLLLPLIAPYRSFA